MRASELIEKLQALVAEFGDLPVRTDAPTAKAAETIDVHFVEEEEGDMLTYFEIETPDLSAPIRQAVPPVKGRI